MDDDDDEEEMPPECKMRMKNIGRLVKRTITTVVLQIIIFVKHLFIFYFRETPTSAGPNSFGKTKLGFCNSIQIKERKLEEEMLCRK